MAAGWGFPQPEVLRVLYVTASSRGDLRVDEEIREVKAAVRAAVHRDGLHIEHLPAATLTDLLNGLSRERPHVVSFSGHASRDLLEFDTGSDVHNSGHRIPAGVFAQAVGAVDTPPRLVVLNACKSQAQLDELVRVVPIAVGMTGSIGDPAAIAFAARFYAALADGQSVRGAYQLARVQLAGANCTAAYADLPILAHGPGIDPANTVLVVPPTKPDPAQG
ncbi:CHAT domain-containing protein [Streptomyces sp. TLI_146]|uniref:CHAT domain-containing protein n=1 Tax=Streptomyces sp. TLI_146 TaxID=1938858 RepID=UPI000CC7BBAE|nr:CHAT domain-containing protein [Streptomyces sp. TLI_146]PKV82735.1 CHAT domain-containing protein [Streptomyces sp. TLI_146]